MTSSAESLYLLVWRIKKRLKFNKDRLGTEFPCCWLAAFVTLPCVFLIVVAKSRTIRYDSQTKHISIESGRTLNKLFEEGRVNDELTTGLQIIDTKHQREEVAPGSNVGLKIVA